MGIQFSAFNSKSKKFVHVHDDDWSPNFSNSNGFIILSLLGLIKESDNCYCGRVSLEEMKNALGEVRNKVTLQYDLEIGSVYKFSIVQNGISKEIKMSADYINSALYSIENYVKDSKEAGADSITWS